VLSRECASMRIGEGSKAVYFMLRAVNVAWCSVGPKHCVHERSRAAGAEQAERTTPFKAAHGRRTNAAANL
jgi:hypothetical protein